MRKDEAEETLRYYQPWRELYREAKNWEYGDFFTHEELSLVLDLPVGTKYYHQIKLCNDQLKKRRQRCLDNVTGKGYRVILPEEHIGKSSDVIGKSLKKYNDGLEIAHCTNTSRLTAAQTTQLADYICHAERFRLAMKDTTKELSAMAGGKKSATGDIPSLQGEVEK